MKMTSSQKKWSSNCIKLQLAKDYFFEVPTRYTLQWRQSYLRKNKHFAQHSLFTEPQPSSLTPFRRSHYDGVIILQLQFIPGILDWSGALSLERVIEAKKSSCLVQSCILSWLRKKDTFASHSQTNFNHFSKWLDNKMVSFVGVKVSFPRDNYEVRLTQFSLSFCKLY